MRSCSMTDVGQRRRENQDYVFTSKQPIGNLPNLFVVADGMGGHNAGDFASCCAVQVLVDSVKKDMSFNPIKIIRHAVETANEKVYAQAQTDPQKAGMGTTLVVVTIVGRFAYVANVGDSRMYLVNPDGITQVTKDHSLIEEMVRIGELTREEARNHPDKNIITRAVGTGETVEIDFFDVQLDEGVRILMCSDGLSNMVPDPEIQEILGPDHDIEEGTRMLVDRANENGGKDNITVVVIEPFTDEVKEC